MKAYIAAPIFIQPQLVVVESIKVILEEEGFEVFSPYHASQSIWKGRAPKDCAPEERAQVLKGNVDNLICDLLVAWTGGLETSSTDNGVAWEMGYVKALGDYQGDGGMRFADYCQLAYIDPNDKRQGMNLMLAATVDAAVIGLEELRAALVLYREHGRKILSQSFHPDKLIAHEREPIV